MIQQSSTKIQNQKNNQQNNTEIQNMSIFNDYTLFEDVPDPFDIFPDEVFMQGDDMFDPAFRFDQFCEYDLSQESILNDNQETIPQIVQINNTELQLNDTVEGPAPGFSTRVSKRKVGLSSNEHLFKLYFYQIFTSKKKFPKELVKKIHDIVCVPCNLPKMTREEFRSIDLYFRNYAKDSNVILVYLHQHKEEILGLVPELKNLK